MAGKKISGTVHIHVDDINSLRFKTLVAYCNALNYKYYVQSDKDIKRSKRPSRPLKKSGTIAYEA
jgi:hypothetical protein